MPFTGPFTRVSHALDQRRDRDRRPVDGTSVRLGALLVFLALVILMVLSASPSMAATARADAGAWSGFINLAPILFWATVGIGVAVRFVLGRRRADRTPPRPSLRATASARPTAVRPEGREHATAA